MNQEKLRWASVISLAFILFLFARGYAAGQVVEVRFPDLVSKAQTILHGKVLKTETKWINDARGRHIYTVATVQTARLMKGIMKENPFIISAVGGRVGDTTEMVSPSYSFEEGEEVVLFLGSKPDEIIGGFQGKITVYLGKVYYGKSEIGIDRFIQTIDDFVRDPNTTKSFNNQDSEKLQLKLDTSGIGPNANMSTPPPRLELHLNPSQKGEAR